MSTHEVISMSIQDALRRSAGLSGLELMTLVAGRQAVKCSRTDIRGQCWEYHPTDNIMAEAPVWFSDDMTAETSEATNQSQIASKPCVQLIGKPITVRWNHIHQTSRAVCESGH